MSDWRGRQPPTPSRALEDVREGMRLRREREQAFETEIREGTQERLARERADAARRAERQRDELWAAFEPEKRAREQAYERVLRERREGRKTDDAT